MFFWNSLAFSMIQQLLVIWSPVPLPFLQSAWTSSGRGCGQEKGTTGWDGWMASPTWWTWILVNSGSWWWTGKPGVLRFMGLQRFRHDWATELNWTELNIWEHVQTKLTVCFHFISDKRTISWIQASENDSFLQKGTTAVWCHDLIKDGSIHWPVYSILRPRRLQSP